MAIHQISVFLENRAGQLAEITALLAKNGVDLRAINIAETSDASSPATNRKPAACCAKTVLSSPQAMLLQSAYRMSRAD